MTRLIPRWAPLALAVLVVLAVVAYSVYAAGAQMPPMPRRAADPVRPDVSVVVVRPGTYQADVSGYGAAQPHYALSLTAQVSGRVIEVSGSLEPGQQVAEGQLLARLEDSDYRAAVASADYELASARQTLLEEERQRVQARTEWEASGLGGAPDSALVLRGPQVATAQAAVTNAEAALASARMDLDQTNILAPFDALVIERAIAPGGYVQAGGDIATLYSTDRVEVTVALSPRDWGNLPDTGDLTGPDGPTVTLRDTASGETWSGHVLRAEGHRSDTTRQRNLVIGVRAPLDREPALLPGTFLQVHVPGRPVDGLWKLPNTAVSQQGKVWIVGDDDALRSLVADTVFTGHDAVYVRGPDGLVDSAQRVLAHPLNSYVTGMRVNPVVVDPWSIETSASAAPQGSGGVFAGREDGPPPERPIP